MAALQAKYASQGLEIVNFPCNQFGGQEPWPVSRVVEWVQAQFGTTFEFYDKIKVNGPNTHPVYQWLKQAFPGDITWNFASKFLVGRSGEPVARFDRTSWEDIEAAIQQQLSESA